MKIKKEGERIKDEKVKREGGSDIVCYNCGKTGHVAALCTEKGRDRNRRDDYRDNRSRNHEGSRERYGSSPGFNRDNRDKRDRSKERYNKDRDDDRGFLYLNLYKQKLIRK